MSDLPELLDHYFSLGVAEGKEGRDHDTPDGEAQATRDLIGLALDRLQRELAEARDKAETYRLMTFDWRKASTDARRNAFEEAVAIIRARMPLYTEPQALNACRECISSIEGASK